MVAAGSRLTASNMREQLGNVTPRRAVEEFSTLLRATPYAESEVLRLLGQGSRCRVFLVRDRGRLMVLKHYSAGAIDRHERRHGGALAHFEYGRNASLHREISLAGRIAEPIGCHVDGSLQLFAQEYVEGAASFERYCRAATEEQRRSLIEDIRDIVAAAHAASIYDLDIHPNNLFVMTSSPSGAPHLTLFDFNKIPYHLAPPNPFFGWLVRCGWIGPESRDRRHLRALERDLQRGRHSLTIQPEGRRRLWWCGLPVPAGSLELEPLLFLLAL